jgi:hypothetical protein
VKEGGRGGSARRDSGVGRPGEQVGDGVVVEEPASLEEAQNAALQRTLETLDVVGSEVRRLVEGDGAIVAAGEGAIETTTWKWK